MDNKNECDLINADEFSVAEKAAEKSEGSYTHKFSQPFMHQGTAYAELTFDWDSCTGDDSLAIENEMQQLGKPLIVPTFSGEYLIRFAARSCVEKIGSDALAQMRIRDYNKIRSEARSFLLKSES